MPQVRLSVPGPKMIFSIAFPIPALDLLLDQVKTVVGFALFFGPRTLWRTWGTRPVPIGFCHDKDSVGTAESIVLTQTL